MGLMTAKRAVPDEAELTALDPVAARRTKLPYFSELDGLRGFASFIVFVHHYLQYLQVSDPAVGPILRAVIVMARFGNHGVDIFFVLSGYLITSLLLIDRGQPYYFHNFYWKRTLRILPVYFVHLILTQLIVGDAWGYIFLSLIFIVNFSQHLHVPLKGVAWTLSIEEQFYLIWPQFVLRLGVKALYYLAFSLMFASIILRTVACLAIGHMDLFLTPYRCDGLALGAILALQWYEPATPAPRPLQPLLRLLNANLTLLLAAIATCVAFFVLDESLFANNVRIATINYLAYRLIRRIIRSRDDGGKQDHATAWLSRAVPAYFGRISYSFYLYHSFIIYLMPQYFGSISTWTAGQIAARFVLALAVTVAACTLSLYAMELPIQRLRRFVLK